MNSETHSEGANRSPHSRRFALGKPASGFQPPHNRNAESPLRGVRTLRSVLQQVLLEIGQGGKP